jgi:hypothetical protein
MSAALVPDWFGQSIQHEIDNDCGKCPHLHVKCKHGERWFGACHPLPFSALWETDEERVFELIFVSKNLAARLWKEYEKESIS